LREQARRLDEDHDLAGGALDTLIKHVIGPNGVGIEFQPQLNDGTIALGFAEQLSNLFDDWCLHPEVTGELDWVQCQQLMARTWLRDGEGFTQLLSGPVRGLDHATKVPFSLELLEPDFVPTDYNDSEKNINGGIKRNTWGKPKSYYVYKQHPGDVYFYRAVDLKQIPAINVLHPKMVTRLHQGRGVSIFARVITRLDDIKDYEESERVAARISAAMAAYIKKGGPDEYASSETAPRQLDWQPDTAIYCCPHCGTPWDDYQRQKNIRDTVYNALVAGDENAGWVATKPFYGKAGFKDLSELYVCLPGTSLSDVVKAYLEAKYLSDRGDESKMIAFVNQKLGNTYEYKGDQADADTLRELAEDYPEKVVPRGALALTAGIDVQHDRLAVVIRAWGRNEESWLIYWGELSADSSTIDKKDAVWDDIDQLLFNGFDHQQFGKIGISGLTIDCSDGTSSDAVYHWVRTRAKKHKGVLVMAGKGSSDLARDPEIFTTPKQKIDHKNPKKTSKADRHGVLVYIVGTGKAKDLISKRLMGGSAFMHTTSQTRADYWDQVTAEVKAPHRSLRNRKVWQLRSGRRNEGGDCEVYAMHAARGLRLHMMTPSKWDQLEHELTQVDLFSAPVVDEKPEPQTETKQAGSAWVKPRTGGWLNRG
jgi:hypothetical protein